MILLFLLGQSYSGASRYFPCNVSDGSVFSRYQLGNSIVDYKQKNLDRKLVSITPHVTQSDFHESCYNSATLHVSQSYLGSSCVIFASPQDGQSYLSTRYQVGLYDVLNGSTFSSTSLRRPRQVILIQEPGSTSPRCWYHLRTSHSVYLWDVPNWLVSFKHQLPLRHLNWVNFFRCQAVASQMGQFLLSLSQYISMALHIFIHLYICYIFSLYIYLSIYIFFVSFVFISIYSIYFLNIFYVFYIYSICVAK